MYTRATPYASKFGRIVQQAQSRSATSWKVQS